ncbi:MAG: PAS domain S-box protein, partial [candidate division NC10 bacterium]|nr:PAS domain S-box protein [candidate division NC10 bacterium]
MGHRKKSFVDQSMLQAGEGRLALHFSRLRWLGVWAPTAFGGLLLWFTLAFHHILPLWLLVLLVLVISAAGAALFSWLVFAQILQREETLNVHARQQAAVAALGQRALARTDLSILMNDAVALVAHTLDVEFCKVLELLPDGTALLLRAGVGWKDGSVGSATVGAGTDSQAGYTLLSNEPVIVEDLRTEPRFSGPPLLRDHGVVSGMSVIIPGADRPFGVLGAHTTRRRTFTTDESHFLQAVANVLATAVERKRAEEALREMNVALAHAMPAISRLDPEGRYVHVNDTYARMIGYEPSEMVGMDWALTVHPDDRGNAITTYHRMVSEGTAEFEARAVRKDGSMFYKHVLMVKIVDKDDTFVGHHCFMRDITARRRAAEALRESEARKGAILESALDCIVTIDHEGMIIEFNPAAERMFGYTRAEVMGKAMAEVIIPPALRDRHRRGLAHYLATGEGPVIGKRLEMPAMRADGTEFPVELAITRIRLE